MKLEVGMYVRTKWGINKINEYVPQSGQLYLKNDVCVKSNVIKASHNIIDLIEVGDYVNGYRVDYIENTNANNNFILQRIFCEEYEKDLYSKSFKPSDIKLIVTKEQFESMSYKIGD